jgi:hypothetical protein
MGHACGVPEATLNKVTSMEAVYRVALRHLGYRHPEALHSDALKPTFEAWRRRPAMDRAPAGGNPGFLERFPEARKIKADGGSPWR